MSIYIGNDLEDRLKVLEIENASLKKYNEYHQVVHEIDHMSAPIFLLPYIIMDLPIFASR